MFQNQNKSISKYNEYFGNKIIRILEIVQQFRLIIFYINDNVYQQFSNNMKNNLLAKNNIQKVKRGRKMDEIKNYVKRYDQYLKNLPVYCNNYFI